MSEKWECAALKQGSVGGNYPAECNWPMCGCDPYADKVLAALEESGAALGRNSLAADRNTIIEQCAAVIDQCNREGPYNAIGGARRIRELKTSGEGI